MLLFHELNCDYNSVTIDFLNMIWDSHCAIYNYDEIEYQERAEFWYNKLNAMFSRGELQ